MPHALMLKWPVISQENDFDGPYGLKMDTKRVRMVKWALGFVELLLSQVDFLNHHHCS